MTIRVKLFSTLVQLSKTKQAEFEIDPRPGLTVAALIESEGFTGRTAASVAAVVNGEQALKERLLQDGDRIDLLVNISGGA